MGFVVKNTTRGGVLDWICPHYCRGCGKLGQIMCECCKKYLIAQKMVEKGEVCACAWRDGLLGDLVEEYKFQSVRAIGVQLGEILNKKLPDWRDVVVVPLPTITAHVRERGLDHGWQLAKSLAKFRGWQCQKILGRRRSTVQVGSTKEERWQQAKEAYRVVGRVDVAKHYILLDDVWTTGASMLAAEKLLREAGANRIEKVVLVKSR